MSDEARYSVYGEWFVQEANGCTCYGGDAHYGHEPGCGYEPLIKLDELKAALAAAGYAVVKPSRIYGVGFRDDDGSAMQNSYGPSLNDRETVQQFVDDLNAKLETGRYWLIYKDVWFGGSEWQVAE